MGHLGTSSGDKVSSELLRSTQGSGGAGFGSHSPNCITQHNHIRLTQTYVHIFPLVLNTQLRSGKLCTPTSTCHRASQVGEQ